MKNNKPAGTLFYIAARCLYAVAAMTFFATHDHSKVVVWICIGTVLPALGAEQEKRSNFLPGKSMDKGIFM